MGSIPGGGSMKWLLASSLMSFGFSTAIIVWNSYFIDFPGWKGGDCRGRSAPDYVGFRLLPLLPLLLPRNHRNLRNCERLVRRRLFSSLHRVPSLLSR